MSDLTLDHALVRPQGLYRLIRPLLFRLPPERAHLLSLLGLRCAGATALGRAYLTRSFAPPAHVDTGCEHLGLTFPSRVGLAAGYDKGAVALEGLTALGFGHIEVGTVTVRPQLGNSGQRALRLPAQRALVNRMGFPSEGAEVVARRLGCYLEARERRARLCQRPVIGVNIGKNRETPNERAAEDYAALIRRLGPLSDYVTLNVSSPNTPSLRALQGLEPLRALLGEVMSAREGVRSARGGPLPVLVKLAPEFKEAGLEESLELLSVMGVSGVILSNTRRVDRPLAGGLSGAPLFEQTLALIERARAISPTLPLIASGGVERATQLQALLEAGADLVQVWTALVYQGPGLLRQLARSST